VTVENGVLTISGEKKDEHTDENGARRIYERTYGRFERSFSLPRGVEAEHVTADFANGVLKIALPKAEAAKPRKVKVKA
jgi:HSP20 family protein